MTRAATLGLVLLTFQLAFGTDPASAAINQTEKIEGTIPGVTKLLNTTKIEKSAQEISKQREPESLPSNSTVESNDHNNEILAGKKATSEKLEKPEKPEKPEAEPKVTKEEPKEDQRSHEALANELRDLLGELKAERNNRPPSKPTQGHHQVSVCPPGERLEDGSCKPCHAGSYSNTFSQECKVCPADTYQPSAGQPRCENCPEHSHTRRFYLGNKDISDCHCHKDMSMRTENGTSICIHNTVDTTTPPDPHAGPHAHAREHGDAAHKIDHLKPSEIGHQDPLFLPGLYHIAQFSMVALAAFQIGKYFTRARLPLISGYLIAGILSGPHLLGLLPHSTTKDLRIVDQLSISCIALAAGMELRATKLQKFIKPILWVLTGFMGATFLASFVVILLFSGSIPFITGMAASGKVAVALLISTIMIARSPASAIAIVKSAQAEGPYSTMVVGVSIAADVLIIVVFALNMGIAKALIRGSGFTFFALLSPISKIVWSAAFGVGTALYMDYVSQAERIPSSVKACLVLPSGLMTFFISSLTPSYLAFEPLLACVLGGVYLINFGKSASYNEKLISRVLPMVNLAFFTSAGAELEIDHLLKPELLVMGLGIFVLRIVSLWLGATLGGWLAGRSSRETSFAWMGYVTQAGVAMGLAKDVASEFPEWGQIFASMMIFQMAINQVDSLKKKSPLSLTLAPTLHP